MTRDDLNTIAWRDFIMWASDQQPMREAFTKSTGIPFLPPAKNGLDALIDKATNAHEKTLRAFVQWVTENHWGLEFAPEAYRNEIRAKVSA